MKRRCLCCGRLFTARSNVPNQQYCSCKKCQNARRQRWRKQKLKTDTDYRADQYAAQKRWCRKNPGCWHKYRSSHWGCCRRNREKQTQWNRKRELISKQAPTAKRYELAGENGVEPGYYSLVPAGDAVIAERYALLVKSYVVSGGYINTPKGSHRFQLERRTANLAAICKNARPWLLTALMGWAGLEGKKLLKDIDNIQLGLGVECSKLPH